MGTQGPRSRFLQHTLWQDDLELFLVAVPSLLEPLRFTPGAFFIPWGVFYPLGRLLCCVEKLLRHHPGLLLF